MTQAMPLIYRQLIVFAIVALLNACANIPRTSPEQRARLEQVPRQYTAQGAWREAAIAWQKAAGQVTGDLATQYRLNAAQALLAAGDGNSARKIALNLKGSLAPRQNLHRHLILAEADLLSGDAGAALRRLGPSLKTRERDLQASYHRLRSEALLVTGQNLAAIYERSLLDTVLEPGPELYSNRQQLWTATTQLSNEDLLSVELQPLSTFSGWIALARIVRRSAQDVESLQAAVNEWNIRYPAHPAGEQIIPQLLEHAFTQAQPPTKVAFLLPLSGPFEAAARAIRDGAMAAWFADAPNPLRPELVFRDSSEGDISNTYNEVLANGAQFIIGPLAKERVTEMLQSGDIQVPTLTLNYPENPPAGTTPELNATPMRTRPVYLFALAPEDEAVHAAERAYARGYRNAAILAPRGSWGERVNGAFNATWNRLGGRVVSQRYYPDDAKELSNSVKQLLNFDRSEARARALRRVLARKIKHDAEPRQDIDIIFLAAFPQAARQIKPLLLFYRAAKLPVIATSHVYTGIVDAGADQDLDGIEFAGMPWILNPGDYGLPTQIQSVWPNARGALGRLYAFGADAYSLISQARALSTPGARHFQGLTGTLWIGEQRRVQRALQWAIMKQGVPSAIATAQ